MRLLDIRAVGYRSLNQFELGVGPLNVLIGANAAGKSNVLDLLRFLHEGLREGSFREPVWNRGGFVHLAWKGSYAERIELETRFQGGETEWTWHVELRKSQAPGGFDLEERLSRTRPGSPPATLLHSDRERSWWWDEHEGVQRGLELDSGECALAAAAKNSAFGARDLSEFVRSWTFFDPQPSALRRAAQADRGEELHAEGANLAARLYWLQANAPERYRRILKNTEAVLGLPSELEFRVSEESGRVHFVQREHGLKFPVHQVGASSGTLRLLAMVTALLGSDDPGLVAIEEPENHLHPSAIDGFAQILVAASSQQQVFVTTHWPPLLDGLQDPSCVSVIRRGPHGSFAERHPDRALIDRALAESGLRLGAFFESTGFGS